MRTGPPAPLKGGKFGIINGFLSATLWNLCVTLCKFLKISRKASANLNDEYLNITGRTL